MVRLWDQNAMCCRQQNSLGPIDHPHGVIEWQTARISVLTIFSKLQDVGWRRQ